MDFVIGAAAALIVALPAGWWAGMRTTARNADRLLAVMSPDEIVATARRARARRAALSAEQE